jgi:hypothetical protein
MAIRNSVKATLFETEQPRSRSEEADAIFEKPAPPVAERPIEKPVAEQPIEKPSAQRPVEKPSVQRSVEKSIAPRSAEIAATAAPVAPPKPPEAAFLAATWAATCHARAEELCALADTLPSKSSWSLISKIAGLYDELARDAGWAAPETPPPEALRLEEAPQIEGEPLLEEAPAADPRPEDRIAFERRPLPQGRRLPRRRA